MLDAKDVFLDRLVPALQFPQGSGQFVMIVGIGFRGLGGFFQVGHSVGEPSLGDELLSALPVPQVAIMTRPARVDGNTGPLLVALGQLEQDLGRAFQLVDDSLSLDLDVGGDLRRLEPLIQFVPAPGVVHFGELGFGSKLSHRPFRIRGVFSSHAEGDRLNAVIESVMTRRQGTVAGRHPSLRCDRLRELHHLFRTLGTNQSFHQVEYDDSGRFTLLVELDRAGVGLDRVVPLCQLS